MSYVIEGIGDICCLGHFEYDTMDHVLDTVMQDKVLGTREVPDNVMTLCVTMAYACDFIGAIRDVQEEEGVPKEEWYSEPGDGNMIENISIGIPSLIRSNGYDEDGLVKQLASFLFLSCIRIGLNKKASFSARLDGQFGHRKIILWNEDGSEHSELNLMAIAKEIIDNGVYVTKDGECCVNLPLVEAKYNAILEEFDSFVKEGA